MNTRPTPQKLDADAFIAWALDQPTGRYELVRGEVVAMAPKRAGHALTKRRTVRALEDAIVAAGLRCQAFPDGMTVRINDETVRHYLVLAVESLTHHARGAAGDIRTRILRGGELRLDPPSLGLPVAALFPTAGP